ncbi:MAG: response regulator transcription factor [Cryobacterium sp.]|nr:response regulator transcription factor [Cryobacterium sp.]
MTLRRTAKSTSHSKSDIRVALVDDFRLLLDGLDTRLDQGGFGVRVAIEASSWHELVSHPEFPPQVTVLDLNLNDTISIGTKIQVLLAAGSEIVVISRHSDPATVARAISAGALSFIPKTQGVDELAVAIRSAARGEKYFPEGIEASIAGLNSTQSPKLGPQEQRAIATYASGITMREVAEKMGTTEETVKSYVKRARRKYRESGVDLSSRAQLRAQGIQEGWFDDE